MKDDIRELLDMVYQNIDNFNDLSLQWIDKKKLRKNISVWRWYVSHGYFNEKHPKPEEGKSNPPIGWLFSQLKGLTVPLHRDIAECIQPVVQSSVKTEHAAKRIMNRLNMIFGYVSPEDIEADRKKHRDAQDKKIKDRLRAAKARDDRKVDKKEQRDLLVEKEQARLHREYMKTKESQRRRFEAARKTELEAVKKRGREAAEKMRQEMKERRL